jgi:phospholipase C
MPIDHIVVLMMENNGFDRMLGWMSNAGRDVDGVNPARPLSNPDRLDGGSNHGFVANYVQTHPTTTPEERREIMAWYPRGFLPALHTLAEHGAVFDRWFASMPGRPG